MKSDKKCCVYVYESNIQIKMRSKHQERQRESSLKKGKVRELSAELLSWLLDGDAEDSLKKSEAGCEFYQ